LNNINDEYVRNYVDAHGRILAVIGLQENPFRPFHKRQDECALP
jgi:hypothetical protein